MDKQIKDKINEQVCKKIDTILEDGLQQNNISMLGQLVNINTDIANQDYWQKKEEVMEMRYDERDYGRRGVPGSGRGRYRGEYGRRGVKGTGRGRYRGEDAMEEMQEHYNNYSEASEEMEYGNYGAEGGMVKSAEGIMKNIYEIIEELNETGSQEVAHIIKKYARKISEMD